MVEIVWDCTKCATGRYDGDLDCGNLLGVAHPGFQGGCEFIPKGWLTYTEIERKLRVKYGEDVANAFWEVIKEEHKLYRLYRLRELIEKHEDKIPTACQDSYKGSWERCSNCLHGLFSTCYEGRVTLWSADDEEAGTLWQQILDNIERYEAEVAKRIGKEEVKAIA